MTRDKRVAALEAKQTGGSFRWHRLLREPWQTVQEAIAAYGHNKIAAGDGLIVRTIHDPKERAE